MTKLLITPTSVLFPKGEITPLCKRGAGGDFQKMALVNYVFLRNLFGISDFGN